MMDKIAMHADICKALNELYQRKNADYGDSFGKSYQEYGMTMACIRLEDKLNRLKSLCKQEAKVQDESLEDTLMDLANYAIMTLVERKRNQAIADYWLEDMTMPDPMDAKPPEPEAIQENVLAERIEEACNSFRSCHECPIYGSGKDNHLCFSEGADIHRNYRIMEEAGVFNTVKGKHSIGCRKECICMKCANDNDECCFKHEFIGCPASKCPDFEPEGEE